MTGFGTLMPGAEAIHPIKLHGIKLHGINPHAYLTDVLTKLVNNWPNRQLGELLPWAWIPEAS